MRTESSLGKLESVTGPPHILLVDDDQQVVRFLKRTLEGKGYSVTATTSGRRALALIEERPPDLLILDLNMPEPNGLELLATRRTGFPYLRTMVISGYMDGALLEAAEFLGAVATLKKPVTNEELCAKVRAVLGR
jgi:CheY-like chemotaxis protein